MDDPRRFTLGMKRIDRTAIVALMAGSAVALVWSLWPASPSATPPEDRAAFVRTTGCGFAGSGSGSGVAVGGNEVITAAHVVGRADAVAVEVEGVERAARITAWDPTRDLAVLEVPGLELPNVAFATLSPGDQPTMVGGLASGTQPALVAVVARLTIEEVLGTERHSRLGYQIRIEAADGDSGAGLFTDEAAVAAVLFAMEDSAMGWATAASEVEAVLAQPMQDYRCDEASSQIAPVTP